MSAGFRYTPTGGTQKTHVLDYPMSFEKSPGRRKNRWAVDSLDYSSREVISIASGRMEVESRLRFNRKSQDLIDMLDHAADGIKVTYYPDLAVNTGYDLWLIGSGDMVELDPQDGRWPLGDYEVPVRFRDASASGTSLEALFSPWLFRYDAGMAVPDATFTRTGTARQIGQFGVLESVATGLPRDGHWPLVDGVRTPALLLEGARTNLVTSDDFSAWSDQNTTTVTGSITDPAGGTGAYTITGDGGATAEARYVTPTFTGDGVKSALFVVKESSMPASGDQRLAVYDQTAAAFLLNLAITSWVAGEPQITASTGTLLGKQFIGNGWWIVYGSTTTVTAANSNRVYVYSNVSASAGAISVYRVNAFDATVPPTMPLDASGVLGAETFDVPIAFAPQECTIYLALKDIGMARNATAFAGDIVTIGRQGSGNGFIQVDDGGGSGDLRFATVGSGGTTASSYLPSGSVEFGDKVEMSCAVSSSFAPTLSYAVAGGAVATAASASNADGMPPAWAADYIRVHSEAILSVKVASGTKTLAEMRAL